MPAKRVGLVVVERQVESGKGEEEMVRNERKAAEAVLQKVYGPVRFGGYSSQAAASTRLGQW